MKTKNLIFGFMIVSGIVLASCSQSGTQQTEKSSDKALSIPEVTISVDESRVIWSGTSLNVYTHTGTAKFTKANLSVKKGGISGGSFTVDLSTMVTTDANYDAEAGYTSEKLLGHLSSPDFLDVANYPTASFIIKSVEGNTATGTLTIRGISKEEKVENIAVNSENGKTQITGDLTFNRKDYDISWDYPAKEMLLQNEVELKIELTGV